MTRRLSSVALAFVRHTIVASADAASVIDELDEANNRATLTVK